MISSVDTVQTLLTLRVSIHKGQIPDGREPSKDAKTNARVGSEAQLWQMAEPLRNNTGADEYKYVVRGLIFLKYISDTFEANRDHLKAACVAVELRYGGATR